MEAKRMRFSSNLNHTLNAERLELKIWQNSQLSRSIEDNYINRLLESTRSFLVASEELTVENEAINTAINTFGLKKTPFDMFDDSASDDSNLNLPTTSTQSPSRQHSTSTSSTETVSLECEAISSAINTYGLTKKDS